MKFLVDAQLPPGLCRWLEARGHEAEHVHSLPDQPAADRAVADHAEREGAVLISKDEDFVRLLRLADRFALLWLRCGNVTNRGLRDWLEPQWPEAERRLEAGARFITIG